MAIYYHLTLFSPPVSTWMKAVKKNYFSTWPGLTDDLVLRYIPKSEFTSYVHLLQHYKRTRFTKTRQSTNCISIPQVEPDPDVIESIFPESSDSEETDKVCLKMYDMQNKIYTDQTGRFPVTSSKGNNYKMVAFEADSNNIMAEPMKSIKASELTTVYAKIHKMLISRGLKPKIYILDNECSQTIINFMLNVDKEYNLVPPHIHRRNASERDIQTFKNHFNAGFCSVHKLFPMHLWFRLIPHGILSLNLL